MGFGFGLISVFGAYFLAGYTAFLSVSAFFKGKGLSIAENSSKWHHKAKISVEEVNMLREYLA